MTASPLAPPARPRSRGERLRAPVVTIGALAATTLALRLRDPHESGSWGYCPTALLGLSCPACGGLRAVNDLTHGEVLAAASSNLLVVVALPFAVLALALWAVDAWRGVRRPPLAARVPVLVRRAVPVALAVVVLAFTVARNVSGSWLAP